MTDNCHYIILSIQPTRITLNTAMGISMNDTNAFIHPVVYVSWQLLIGLLCWRLVMEQSLCNSFEDLAPVFNCTGARSSNDLQWPNLMMGHQDSSASNGCQRDMSYCDETGCRSYPDVTFSEDSLSVFRCQWEGVLSGLIDLIKAIIWLNSIDVTSWNEYSV